MEYPSYDSTFPVVPPLSLGSARAFSGESVKKDPKAPVILGRAVIACNMPPLQEWWDGKRTSQIKRQALFFLMLLPLEAHLAAHRFIHRFSVNLANEPAGFEPPAYSPTPSFSQSVCFACLPYNQHGIVMPGFLPTCILDCITAAVMDNCSRIRSGRCGRCRSFLQ